MYKVFIFAVPPTFQNTFQTKSTKLWKTESLFCSCEGDMPINVTWFKNDHQLINDAIKYEILDHFGPPSFFILQNLTSIFLSDIQY